ncbi:MAG: class C sortase [Oscillospiraceae bacterium]|nr:class C sortase [Oscillospiraceae bacterium]
MEAKKRKNRKNGFFNFILVLILLIGLSLLVYPSFSDYWNSFHQTRAIASYMESVSSLDNTQYDAIMAAAREYNSTLDTGEFRWFLPEDQVPVYESQLNINDIGQMGYISIDKIHVQLPLYHGTSESVLQTSIGHIDWTSLPTGGEGTHCVFSGHRGLPSARLFTDLDKMTDGDVFQLSILNETLTYQVDQIRVVEPTDLSELQIVPGKDYCTLVTCTPYGINTHRLLVRGHRVANPQGDAKVVSDAMQIDTIYVVPFVGVPILLILLIMMLFATGKHARHHDSYSEITQWERELQREPEPVPTKPGPKPETDNESPPGPDGPAT